MPDKHEPLALFRFGLIAPLVLESLPRGELTRRAGEIAARSYDIPGSQRRRVSLDTLLDWAMRYRRNGLPALYPKARSDRGQTRAVTPEAAALVERLMRENPHRTGTALLRELALDDTNSGPSPSTLYRFLRARGLTSAQLLQERAAAHAHKKYEAEFANQIWQSDMLFGPWVSRPGGGKRQVFLQATLDDASRLIPHAQFYPDQGLDCFLDCLRKSIAARGLPAKLYMDNAKIYRSPQLSRIAASIGIAIAHTPPYQPEGRGKIERFFRTVREQFLASLDPKSLLSLDSLNERFWHWLDDGLSPPRTRLARIDAPAALATRHRPHPPTRAGHRLAPRVPSPRGPPRAARLHLPTVQALLRGAAAAGGPARRGPFRPARSRPPRDLVRRQTARHGASGRRSGQRDDLPLMWQTYFGFKKEPFSDHPDSRQVFDSEGRRQVGRRLEFLAANRGVGLLTRSSCAF